MISHAHLTWSWLNILTKKRYDHLISEYESLETALTDLSSELLKKLGCREDTILKTMNRYEEFDASWYESELVKRQLSMVCCDDEQYPSILHTLPDPPVFLTYRGDLSILKKPCIAVVGTREMSEYGKRVVGLLLPDLVREGLITVSGLAQGIDGEVAKITIDTGGKTVAIVGHGLGMMYPKHHERLAESIVEHGGLLMSEFPLDTRPDIYTFPARNRIIAGLSQGTVVVEAAKDSGSLITASLALEYNRDVFAVPGPIFDAHYEGCHHLITRGEATLVSSAADILAILGIVTSKSKDGSIASPYITEDPTEQAILATLTRMPMTLDDLAEKTSIELHVLSSALTMLELANVVTNLGGGKWVANR